MAIYWKLATHMRTEGWTNASKLAEAVGISKPAAYRIFEGKPLDRIDVATLEALARKLKVKPLTLLEYKKEKT
jgi:DNA-binding Xre family transcriptional regulator